MISMKFKSALGAIVLGLAVGGGISALGLAEMSSSDAAETQSNGLRVTIDNFTFTPGELTVKAGTSVTWINRDDIPHTVVSNDRRMKSTVLDTDDKFTITFNEAGTFKYFCSIHPHMTGKVRVVP